MTAAPAVRAMHVNGLDSKQRIELLNRLAVQDSIDESIRYTAGVLVNGGRLEYERGGRIYRRNWPGVKNVPDQFPAEAARFIRWRYLYLMEPPGIEVFQGPVAMAKTGVHDCDCGARAWVALMRAAGLEAYAAGVTPPPPYSRHPFDFFHAVGYDPRAGRHYELIDDRKYVGGKERSIRFTPSRGSVTVYFAPEPWKEGFMMAKNGGPYRPVTQIAQPGTRSGARYAPFTRQIAGSSPAKWSTAPVTMGVLGLGLTLAIGGFALRRRTK